MAYDLIAACKAARACAPTLGQLGSDEKNRALAALSTALAGRYDEILAANAADVADARAAGMRESLLDRLTLTPARLDGIRQGIAELIALPDPVGIVKSGHIAPNGLKIEKISVPIGVIGVIYEARPNVSVDVAALCLKSGNVCLLRGGKEAYRSNKILIDTLRSALSDCGLCPDFIGFIDSTDRAVTEQLLVQDRYLDCLIPRGGASLIQAVRRGATVPVIETGAGICHLYADRDADLDKAVRIIDNAKTSRPSVCNAAEVLLVHQDIAEKLLPMVRKALDAHAVELRCCPRALAILGASDKNVAAGPHDFDTEFGDYRMAVRVVGGIDEAIAHIAEHSTRHSEAILSENITACERFVRAVDAAAVYVNASTRFTDGGCFGLGAEIGISTQKLHARGPMGLNELTTVKYTVYGDGQIRA